MRLLKSSRCRAQPTRRRRVQRVRANPKAYKWQNRVKDDGNAHGAGRGWHDGAECWVAVSTEAFARELIGAPAAAAAAGAEPTPGPSGVSNPSGVPTPASLPPASAALLAAAADALWPPLRALLARAHG